MLHTFCCGKYVFELPFSFKRPKRYFQPFFHFLVFFECEGSRGWRFDELGCEFDEFLVVNFADFRNDLRVRESGVCFAVVGE